MGVFPTGVGMNRIPSPQLHYPSGVPHRRGDEPDPAEIWLTWVAGNGKVRLCKRYIGVYADEKGKAGGYAVFDLIGDAWQGTTIFKPRKLDYLDDYRRGTLLYTK